MSADIVSSFNGPWIQRIEGFGDVTFPRLSTRELVVFGAKLRLFIKDRNLADAKALGFTQIQLFRVCDEVNSGTIGIEVIAASTDEPQMQIDIVTASLKKAGREDADKVVDALFLSMDSRAFRDFARMVGGVASLFEPIERPKPPAARGNDTAGFGINETPPPGTPSKTDEQGGFGSPNPLPGQLIAPPLMAGKNG